MSTQIMQRPPSAIVKADSGKSAVSTVHSAGKSVAPKNNETTEVRDSQSSHWHNLDNRLAMIAEAAYFKAEKRGFEVGHDVADWLQAEQELAEIMGEA